MLVAPGVALTARHVTEEMRVRGFLAAQGGHLLAFGFHHDGMAIWNPRSFTTIGDGDLAMLTLTRVTAGPGAVAQHPIALNVAVMAARQPWLGEIVSLVGYAASEIRFDMADGHGAGVSLLGGVGPITDLYSAGRDLSLPNPAIGICARTVGGMSGAGAFDEHGRLIGVITSGLGEERSFVSLCWPSAFTPLQLTWPPGLVEGDDPTLHSMAGLGLCRIEGLDALHADREGDDMRVSLSW